MAEYVLRSPIDPTTATHDYTDDDRPAVISDDDDGGASAVSDDEGGQSSRPEMPIHKQLDSFKKLILSQQEIDWAEIWNEFDRIDDRPENGQSEVDKRTALHILVAEHVQSTDKDTSSALIKAIANITHRCPGLVSRLDKGGKTPLYDAIANKQPRVVRNIVKNCGTRKPKTSGKEHPLAEAIRVHCSYNGRKENALHIAFREMPKAVDKETLKTMCEHATEDTVSYTDLRGFTPLHYAVRYRHSSMEQYDIITTLLDKGAKTRARGELDVLDRYASVRPDKDVVLMSIFEYHMFTRGMFDQDSAASTTRKRTGKEGDSAKSGKNTDKKREETISQWTTVDPKRAGGTSAPQTIVQSQAGANPKQAAETQAAQPERPAEHRKDVRTGRSYKEKDDKRQTDKPVQQRSSNKQGGHRPVDDQKPDVNVSAPANIGITRSNTGAAAPVKVKVKEIQESAEEKKLRRDAWSDKIQNELKIQILRHRPFDKATRFLYGKNLNNIHIYFDYQGQAISVDPDNFEDSFKDVKFDKVLKYVAFPHVKVEGWNKHADNPLKEETRGRSDMLFFFQWLRRQGVERILKVIVDDVYPDEHPHSDEAIELCLKGMGVEVLEWQKKDLDPDTICRIDGSCGDENDFMNGDDEDEEDGDEKKRKDEKEPLRHTLRVLRLWWNGDNAVLRGWSDPDGLRKLEKLSRIHLTTRKSLESKDRTERNIAAFKARMSGKQTLSAPRKASLTVDTGPGSTEVLSADRSASGPKKELRFDVPSTPEEPEAKGILVTYAQVGQHTGSKVHSGSHDREVSVRPSHRWLGSTDEFGPKVAHVWKKLVNERKTDKPRDIVIALIDDGVDATHNRLQKKIVPGRTLSSDNDRIRPWYVSERGHGTLMATSICRVCPMAKIYPIRLHTTGANNWQSSIDAHSAILAIEAAVDMEVDIISISWTVKVPTAAIREKFKAAVDRAMSEGILIFCSAADIGHYSDQHYPSGLGQESFIRVGAAKADGLPYEMMGPLERVDFILPGVDVMSVDPGGGISQAVMERSETGSSIAAALGAGLAAMILHCIYIGSLSGKEGFTLKEFKKFHKPDEMKEAFKRFGMSTSKDSGGKFIEVFHKLDKTSLELSPSTPADAARGLIASLARDFTPRS